MDVEAYREASRQRWERAAPGWARQRSALQRQVAAVSRWMLDAVAPRAGEVVLELAAGPADTGLEAARRVTPNGRLICSDFAEPMLAAARARARELEVDNVEFRRLDGEALELPDASVDVVLCRWGYMLMADPLAALRESRRVLRVGGRVALAAWDSADLNPWMSLAAVEARRWSSEPAPGADQPGMFAFSPPGRIQQLLAQAGFAALRVEGLDLTMDYDDFEHWWSSTLDLSRPLAEQLASMTEPEAAELRSALMRAAEPFASEGGSLSLPARALLAAARVENEARA